MGKGNLFLIEYEWVKSPKKGNEILNESYHTYRGQDRIKIFKFKKKNQKIKFKNETTKIKPGLNRAPI